MTEIRNLEAEQELLGSLLAYFTPSLLTAVRAEVKPDDFYYRRHTLVWRAMLAVCDAGDHVDALVVGSFLRGRREASSGRTFLDLAGGEAGLQLLVACAQVNGVLERARIVAADGEWRRRLARSLAQVEACHARDESAWQQASSGEVARLRVIEGGAAA